MSIQGTINQAVSIAALLASRRGPQLQLERMSKSISGTSEVALEQKASIAKEQWKAKPTAETFASYEEAERNVAASKAQKRLADEQKRIRSGRRLFTKYLSKMPTSYGGVVGDLPKDLQKTIAKSYTPYMRKKLMDEMDAEKKGGKNNG